MRRWSVALVLIAPLILLSGCGGATEAPADEPTGNLVTECNLELDRSQLTDELYIFNWSEYLDPALVDQFETEFGVEIIEDFFDTNEDMLTRLRTGSSGYDIAVPSDYAVQIMIQEGLVAPLNKELLSNMQHLDATNLDLYFDPGNTYSIPYFWGTTGIAYNEQFFDEPPDSYAYLFAPEHLQAINGRFSMLNDPRDTPGAALLYLDASVNTTDAQVLEEVEALLMAQKPFLTAYDSTSVNLRLATEEIIIAQSWSGMAATAYAGIEDKPGNPNIAYLIPQEGGIIWQDNLVILAESQNQYTAHAFINYMMCPQIAAQNTDYVLYLTPNTAAAPLLAEETQTILARVQPDAAALERLEWIRRDEATNTVFTNLWTRVTAQ